MRRGVFLLVSSILILGVEALCLGFKIQFPLTLVIPRQAIAKYQLLFRHLFSCKKIEALLANTWVMGRSHSDSADSFDKSLENRIFSITRHMTVFLKNCIYYFCYDCIEPNWNSMEAKLKHVLIFFHIVVNQYCGDAIDTFRFSR